MKGISPEVERLMWLIAEQRDPRAIADFESRFPDLKYELSKRISMVNSLKSAGRKVPQREIPRFVPPRAAPRPSVNRSMYVAFAFILGAIAFGSYSIATYNMRTVAKPPVVEPVVLDTPKAIDPGIKLDPGQPNPLASHVPNGTAPVPNHDEPHLPPDDPLGRSITLRVEHAPIEAAIAMVCKQAGATYELAPGMMQEDVSMDYQGESAMEILADLGAKHGFTAIPQESGKILIIPVRDEARATPPSSNSAVGMGIPKTH